MKKNLKFSSFLGLILRLFLKLAKFPYFLWGILQHAQNPVKDFLPFCREIFSDSVGGVSI
jgi:hypothetical protein